MQAKTIDLLSYMKIYEPNNLHHLGGDSYCTVEHDSLKISNGKWNWFSHGVGGTTALQYLITVREMEFVDAVMRLRSEPTELLEPPVIADKKEFALPKAYSNNDRVIWYLQNRGIHNSIINYCIKNNSIYESKDYLNAVIVGFDEIGTPRYAALRGTWQTEEPF